jgi:TM2 domain-containing membrane protein YozV
MPNYDPQEYSEAEKEQMVDDREAEIRSAIRERIIEEDEGQIDEEVETALTEYRDEARSELEETMRAQTGELDPAVTDAVVNVSLVALDGLITDMSYDEYRSELDAAKDNLADAVATMAENQLDEEVPDQLDITDEMGPDTRHQFETARDTVQLADLLSLALPGLGQVYNRDIGLGIFFFVSFVFAVLSLMFLVGIVLVPAIWLYSIYDAFVTAQRRREEYEASQVDAP